MQGPRPIPGGGIHARRNLLVAGLLVIAVLAGISAPGAAWPPPGITPDYDCEFTPFNRAWTSAPIDGCPWADQGPIDLGTTVTFNTNQQGAANYDDELWFRIVGPGPASTFDGCTSDGDTDVDLSYPRPNWGYEQLGGLSINFVWSPPMPGLYHAIWYVNCAVCIACGIWGTTTYPAELKRVPILVVDTTVSNPSGCASEWAPVPPRNDICVDPRSCQVMSVGGGNVYVQQCNPVCVVSMYKDAFPPPSPPDTHAYAVCAGEHPTGCYGVWQEYHASTGIQYAWLAGPVCP